MRFSPKLLAAAKIEELVAEAVADGGTAVRDKESEPFDLVVRTRSGKKFAYEIKVAHAQRNSAEDLARLERLARERGFDDFRVVFVYPPKPPVLEVEELDEKLFEYFVNDVPNEILNVGPGGVVEGVTNLDLHVIQVSAEHVRVAGDGLIDVLFEYGGGADKDGLDEHTDFPFKFDVTLSRDLDVEEVHSIEVDTSSYYGEEDDE